jgi:hypothetical protein
MDPVIEIDDEDDIADPDLMNSKSFNIEKAMSVDLSTEMYHLYCLNLRARKFGDSCYLNYYKIDEDEDVQMMALKNKNQIDIY